jgi:hypothetical protein
MQDGTILDAIAALGVAILQRSDRVEVLPAPFSDDRGDADARANTPAKEKNVVSDEPDNPVLVYLRRIDQKVATLIADMADIKHHMTSMVRQHAERRLDLANVPSRLHRLDVHMDRIERRLDLVAATAA